jgi:hypothetical protein
MVRSAATKKREGTEVKESEQGAITKIVPKPTKKTGEDRDRKTWQEITGRINEALAYAIKHGKRSSLTTNPTRLFETGIAIPRAVEGVPITAVAAIATKKLINALEGKGPLEWS